MQERRLHDSDWINKDFIHQRHICPLVLLNPTYKFLPERRTISTFPVKIPKCFGLGIPSLPARRLPASFAIQLLSCNPNFSSFPSIFNIEEAMLATMQFLALRSPGLGSPSSRCPHQAASFFFQLLIAFALLSAATFLLLTKWQCSSCAPLAFLLISSPATVITLPAFLLPSVLCSATSSSSYQPSLKTSSANILIESSTSISFLSPHTTVIINSIRYLTAGSMLIQYNSNDGEDGGHSGNSEADFNKSCY